MTSIITRLGKPTGAVTGMLYGMRRAYLPLDQITQYLVLASPALAEYKDLYQRPEEKKKEEKPIQDYKDITEEDALKCIKERDANITLDKSQN